MGRKIPGRKHRGVRDPEQQRAQRLLAKKVDAPPADVDDQPVPKSVLRIKELMTKSKITPLKKKIPSSAKKPKKSKKLVVVQAKVAKGEKPVPKFEQRKGESDHAFLYRVNRICENVKREAAFEKKYGIDVKRNQETGEVEGIQKRKKDPVELMLKNVKKEKKEKKLAKKKKKVDVDGNPIETPKYSKAQKRRLKLKKKKEKRNGLKLDEFKKFSDDVKFGDVVHAPPSLTAPKFFNKKNEAPRPGQKELLLKSLIKSDKSETKFKKAQDKSVSVLKGVANKVIDKKGKRKDLPNALRRQLDKQQKEIIQAYKTIKAKKYQLNS